MWTTITIIAVAVIAIRLLAPRIPALQPYLERESLAAFFLGVSSGFPYAMIGATLTTRLAQEGIDKKTVTAFTLAFLVYNLKVFWAWVGSLCRAGSPISSAVIIAGRAKAAQAI